jgi:hypothetical protein
MFANLRNNEGRHEFQNRQGINVIPYEIHNRINLFYFNSIVKKIFSELLDQRRERLDQRSWYSRLSVEKKKEYLEKQRISRQ